MRSRRLRTIASAIALVLASTAHAQDDRGDRAEDTPVLRVGTSGDYAPFSTADGDDPPGYTGFAVELARRYAADRGRKLEFVPFRWKGLLEDLGEARFDLAWSGITVRPERTTAGRFSLPVLETGAVVLVPEDSWSDLDALDRPQIRIAVNAGGHLERVAEQRFRRATRIAIADNASVLNALVEGSVQAVVTDSAEAPRWLEALPGHVALPPFTRDRKAALVRADLSDLAADLDTWLLEQERDGTLEALRREHVGPGPWRATADPLEALLAAVDERLSLMPIVGYVKRNTGIPLEVPEREDVVLEAAGEAVLAAASARERVPPSLVTIRRFFRAQMEAAKQVQRDAVADTTWSLPEPWPSLDDDLRPALLRLGERIAGLILELPPMDDAEAVEALAAELLREPRLAPSSRRAIAQAIAELSPATGHDTSPDAGDQARDAARASSPAATGNAMQTP